MVILDELDKVGGRTSQFGSPAAALLEVLDPAQNTRFADHFVGLPVDLSEVLWIGTANYVDAMSPPLRDRMDVIEVAGHTDDEKVAIVKCHLETVTARSGLATASLSTGVPGSKPRELTAAAGDSLPPSSRITEVTGRRELPGASAESAGQASDTGGPSRLWRMTDAAIRAVIRGYTCESGVRSLLRLVGGLCEEVACRRVATGDIGPVLIVADEGECSDAPRRLVVDEVLGPPQHETLPDDVRDVIAREMSRVTAMPRAELSQFRGHLSSCVSAPLSMVEAVASRVALSLMGSADRSVGSGMGSVLCGGAQGSGRPTRRGELVATRRAAATARCGSGRDRRVGAGLLRRTRGVAFRVG